jgi:ribosomal-protein-alanine N-acetyltransferase
MSVTVERLAAPLPAAGSADAQAVLALEAATQDRPLPLAAVLAEAGESVDGVVVVARDSDGGIVGMASARLHVDEAHVIRLAVEASQRRGGVGRALLDALLAWAREQAAGAVVLEVRDSNAPAQALYAAAGFVADGRRPRYYPDGEDALLWRLMLVGPRAGRD